MSSAPPVSVLLPVRDAVATIEVALTSVRAQTDPDFELLVVDDGSSDGTAERLRAAAHADARIRVLRGATSGEPGDLVRALELGRAQARGEMILRMDADDLAHPRRLELCRAALEADPDLAVVGCLVRSFPEVALQGGRRRYDDWLNGLRRHDDMARERFVESPLAHPSVLFRARAVEAVGGYRRFDGPEDYDLWLRLFAAGARFAKVDRVLHFWREDPARLSRRDARYGSAGFARARARALGQELGSRPAAIVGAGTAGRRLARALLAEGVRVTRFLDLDPRKAGRAPHGVPVVGPEEGLRARRDEVLLSCVNAWGARAQAREWLTSAGLREGEEFFLAA